MMDEGRYNGLIAAAFKRLVAGGDEIDPDVVDTVATGDMVTFTSAGGEKCIVNTQRAVRQVWVAGQSQGIHFIYDETSGRWLDDKGRGLELFAFVAESLFVLSGVRPKF